MLKHSVSVRARGCNLTPRRGSNCNRQNKALELYTEGLKTSKEIAKEFEISPATLTVWAKKSGIPLRGRGRQAAIYPSPPVQLLLLEAWTHTYEVAAHRCGVTKQCIGQVAQRWRGWAVAEFGPRDINSISSQPPIGKSLRGSPRVIRPRIITFRVSDWEMTELLAHGVKEGEVGRRSPHSIARDLLVRSLNSAPRRD